MAVSRRCASPRRPQSHRAAMRIEERPRRAEAVSFPSGIGGTVVHEAFAGMVAVEILRRLENRSEYYLVGGAVRDLVTRAAPPSDLDIIAPNGDRYIHAVLSEVGRARRNRHGNLRYSLPSGRHIDVIEPRFFYGSFQNAAEALAYFDASVNAIGLRLGDGRLLDPIDGLADLLKGRVALPVARWTQMSDFESVHLAIRLTRLLERVQLEVVNPDIALAHLGKFDKVAWGDLARLDGVTRSEAKARFLTVLADARRHAGCFSGPSHLSKVP